MARTSDDKQKEKLDIKAEIEKLKRTLAQKLPGATRTVFDLGVASSILVAVGTIVQQSPDQVTGLVDLLSQLGVNWLAQIVLDMRNQADKWSKDDLAQAVQHYEPVVALQLTDAKLRDFTEQIDLATAWMKALNTDMQRKQWLENAARSGVYSPEQLQAAASAVNLNISGPVSDSVILAAGRDISNVTITVNGSRRDMRPFIELYQNELVRRLSPLALGGVVAGASRQTLELAQVYTPLTTPGERVFGDKEDYEKFIKQARRPEVFTEDDTNKRLIYRGPVSILSVLNDTPRAVVLGGAGSGKSTVLNYLGLGLCSAAKHDDFATEWTHRNLVPVVVTLRRFARVVRDRIRKDDALRTDPCRLLLDYVRDHSHEGMRHVSPELADNLNDVLLQHGAVWLLDGLDEVQASYRKLVNEAIQTLVARYPRCRYVATCRTYSYREEWQKLQVGQLPAFQELPVLPFEDDQIDLFVARWYDEVARKRNKPDATQRARRLSNAIGRKRYLRRMAASPLLLSLMADLHSSDNRELPEDRWVLLREALDMLIYRWQANKSDDEADPPEDVAREQRIRAEIERQGNDRLIEALSRLAYDVHREGVLADAESTVDISEPQLMAALRGLLKDFDLDDHDLADYLRERASLVVDDGGEPRVYRFPHRIFQEYLAAYAMRNKPGEVAKLLDDDYARWREVYALVALMKSDEASTAACVNRICKPGQPPQTEADWRRVLLAADIWVDRRVSDETKADAEEVRASIDWVRDCLLHLMRQSALPAPERAEAGRHLAKLGDTRPSVLDVDHIDWCHIPAGDFIMGSGDDDDLASKDEKPQFTYRIRHAYDICTYPITNAQFEQFVKDKGYERVEFWDAAIAAKRWANGRVTDYAGERDRPRDFGEPFNLANHPVVGITWYEAVAFTVWLSQRLGQVVSLPTEAEWERAARGTAGLRYPWGNDPDPNKANYDDTGIGTPSAVGCFPQGVQLQTDCEDMSGNVWEVRHEVA